MPADLYGLLGVACTADAGAIRKAYRRASKRAHPDCGGSAEKFRAVKQALEVLTDPLRRKAYDETGKVEDKPVDNAESEMMGLVSALLDQVLQSLDQQGVAYEAADLTQRMRALAAERQTAIHQQRKAMKNGIAKQRRLLERFKKKSKGENRMEALISGRIAFMEGQEAVGQRHLDQMRKAELFLQDYQFESEKSAPRQSNNPFMQYVVMG
jgi:curved DNA-binding protein CbpA